jgi:hypothetical protein
MSQPTSRKPPDSFAQLAEQVVRASPTPLPFDEILRRVGALRRIDTRSPASTLRNAIASRRMIASTGQHTYGWYPRLITGSFVRAVLAAADLAHHPPRVAFDDDARELLWPGFFDYANRAEARAPVTVELASGPRTSLTLDHFQESDWGTYGSDAFWAWLRSHNPRPGDALILHALDAEQRRYGVAFEPQDRRDAAAYEARNAEMFEAVAKYLHNRRAWGSGVWDVARHLLCAGRYRHPVPPQPVTELFNAAAREMAFREMAEAGIYQLRITLQNTAPPIWRRVQVPGDWSLGALHYVLQVAMGWTNSHLHLFRAGRRRFTLYEIEELRTTDASGVTVGEVWRKPGQCVTYEYDFGDNWTHDVVLEATLPPERDAAYPRCVAGERACPPEDCGGPPGYEDLLAALADPASEDHAAMAEWARDMRGGDFDPETFSLADTNQRLARIHPLVLDDTRNVHLFAPEGEAESTTRE